MNLLANISYEILKTIAILSEGSNGWRKEMNLISWNGRTPKYDIRDWSANREKMGKGVTLSEQELQVLIEALGRNDESLLDHHWFEDLRNRYPLFVSEIKKLLLFVKESNVDFSVMIPLFTEDMQMVPLSLEGTDFEQFFGEIQSLKEIYRDAMEEFISRMKNHKNIEEWLEIFK